MSAVLDPWIADPAQVVLPRVAVLVVARRGTERDAFHDALRGYRDTVLARMPAGSTVRVGVPFSDDPLASGVADWDAMPIADAFVEVSWPEVTGRVDHGEPIRGLAGDLAAVIDAPRSAAVAGRCHLLETGHGAYALAGGARRAAGTTQEQLIDWWYHHHGPLVLSILDPKPVGYQQLHPDFDASRAAAAAAGVGDSEYHMFASSYFASADDFFVPLSQPGVSETLRADEEGHYDHASMFGALFEML